MEIFTASPAAPNLCREKKFYFNDCSSHWRDNATYWPVFHNGGNTKINSANEVRTEDKEKTELSNKTLREERYTKTVDQFNSQTSVIGRANAIDNLGKLASDPDFDDYYQRIIDTLVIFISENSKVKKKPQPDEKISPDVQAALKVLGWRRGKFGVGESQRLDLSETFLRRADLKRGVGAEGTPRTSLGEINEESKNYSKRY